jgi:anti-anti-sigma factor
MKSRILIAFTDNRGFVKIEGEGTFQNAGSLKRALMNTLEKGAKEFIIDLGDCELLDSTMLGIILGFGLKCRGLQGISIHVVKANDEVRALFKNLGLDRLF